MKKILLAAAMAVATSGAFAQAGSLRIKNTNLYCDITVTMYAIDA